MTGQTKEDIKKNRKIAYTEGWLSVTGNIILFFIKYWAGAVTGSIAIIADAWHTLSDSISSIVLLISVKVSHKAPDSKHPFGHGRAELIGSLIIGVLLALIAFNFGHESIIKLHNREAVVFGTLALTVTIISIVIKEILAQYAIWAGKKTGSRALIADGWHHRSDAISSLIILAGIFLGKYFWWIDGILGMIVAVLIFHAAYKILKDTISPLLGEVPDQAIFAQIKAISNRHCPFEPNVHHLHIHRYGHHTELTFHINLPSNLNLEKAHAIASDISRAIYKELGYETTVHMEPIPQKK